jgi:hypothetical protein
MIPDALNRTTGEHPARVEARTVERQPPGAGGIDDEAARAVIELCPLAADTPTTGEHPPRGGPRRRSTRRGRAVLGLCTYKGR